MRHVSHVLVARALTRVLMVGLIVACTPALRQAAGDVQHDNDSTQLRLQTDGSLLGQVLTYDEKLELRPAQVRITFARGAEIASVAQTDAEGMFRAVGLSPGSYSVFTTGVDGFAAFAMRVLPAEVPVIGGASVQGQQPALNGETPLAFGQASGSSYQLFRSLVETDLGRGKMVDAKPRSSEDLAKAGLGSQPQSTPLSQVKSSRARATRNADHDVTHTHLRVDGNLVGRVMSMDNGEVRPEVTQVSFLQSGQTVATVRTDEWGYFQVVGLRPGLYTVMSVSTRGFSAFSVSVQPFESRETVQPGPQQQTLLRLSGGARVVFTSSGAVNFNVVGYSPAPSEDYGQFASQTQGTFGPPPLTTTPVAGGTPPPMGGGGGGGGMGGAGMAGMLGAVGAGLGAGGNDSGTPGSASTPHSP